MCVRVRVCARARACVRCRGEPQRHVEVIKVCHSRERAKREQERPFCAVHV